MQRGREREMERAVSALLLSPSTGSGCRRSDLAPSIRYGRPPPDSIRSSLQGARHQTSKKQAHRTCRVPPWPPTATRVSFIKRSRDGVVATLVVWRGVAHRDAGPREAWRGSGGCCSTLGVTTIGEKGKESQAQRKMG